MDNSSVLINRFFSRSTFKKILDEGESQAYSATIDRYIENSSILTNLECIRRIYYYLRSQYQNEYYYKNTLFNKLLLGIHNTHTTTALSELPIENSKADFILINGKAVVYEIKTALDNLERLERQLDDYYKAFAEVAVVTSERYYEEVERRLVDTSVGIFVLTKRGQLSERKKTEKNIDKLSYPVMFKILRKREYEEILQLRFGELPQVSPYEYYRMCMSWFESIPIEEAYQDFLLMLKNRSKIEIDEFEKVPYELKALVYFSNYKKDDYSKLIHFLYS